MGNPVGEKVAAVEMYLLGQAMADGLTTHTASLVITEKSPLSPALAQVAALKFMA